MAALGGTIDKQVLLKVYMETIQRLSSTQILYIPQCGMVERTSGVNKYASLVGDMSANNNDATQSTEATQPFVGGYIAPSEMRCIKRVTGQTQTGLLSFATAKNFLATDSWTLRVRRRINRKGTGRLYLGANSYMSVGDSSVLISNGTNTILTCSATLEAGRTHTIEFQYSNGTGLIKINNIPYTTTVVSAAMTFDRLAYNSTYPVDCCMFSYHLSNTRASEIEGAQAHAFLQSMFPDIESVTIGNQVWATSNFEAVAGDGTVIPEVQGATTDGNAELFIPTWLNASTGWNMGVGWSVSGGLASSDGSQVEKSITYRVVSSLVVGKYYRITYTVSNYSAGSVFLLVGDSSGTGSKSANGTYTAYVECKGNLIIGIQANADFVGSVGSVSYKEVGRADATTVYDSVYAATTGTAYQKEVAALKAAAMWAYPDDSPVKGAVYGKLFNGYATRLFAMFPPVKGWHVPSQSEFTQLIDYPWRNYCRWW